MSKELSEIDFDELDTLGIPKRDLIGEELVDAHSRERNAYRAMIAVLGLSTVVLATGFTVVAMRPPVTRYVRISDIGQATAIRYSDMDYTPQVGEARYFAEQWALYRYQRLRATIGRNFPLNYLFMQRKLATEQQNADEQQNVVAAVLATRAPENDIEYRSTDIERFAKQTIGGKVYATGQLTLHLVSVYPNSSEHPRVPMNVSVSFIFNPAQVGSSEYQRVNPLGFTITEFHENLPYAQQ